MKTTISALMKYDNNLVILCLNPLEIKLSELKLEFSLIPSSKFNLMSPSEIFIFSKFREIGFKFNDKVKLDINRSIKQSIK